VSSRVVERDLIVVVVPVGFDLRTTDSRQLGGRTMISCTTDLSGEELDRRLVAPGASPNRAATGETTVRLGRLLGCPVLLRTCWESARRACVTDVADVTSVATWRLLPHALIPPT
jgi:hypothetical protein